ncbi:MAG: TolC family protein [Gemmatimonadota bacterium]|nr:MAG: TolC family protein [Gemmatimonadota bacterium]
MIALRTPVVLATLCAIGGWAPGPALGQVSDGSEAMPVRQEISLEQAISQALRGNAALGIAESRSEAAEAGAQVESAALYPSIDLSAGYVRTTDPARVFAIKLQQGRFTEADFDVANLNDPDPIGDWKAGADFSWSVLDPTRWAGSNAAGKRASAAAWGARWAREATVFQTKLLYFRAVQAEERLAAERASKEAARATVERFTKRLTRGLITRAELLQAESELEAALARSIAVEDGRERIVEELAQHLGWDPGVRPVPTDTLIPPPSPTPGEFNPEERADLRRLEALEQAAGDDVTRATMSFIPAVDAFANFSNHAEDVFASDGTDWTVGFALRWNLFSGFRRTAARRRAELDREARALEYEEALRAARNEAVQARRGVLTAESAWRAMHAARLAAEEGRDLMRRRFEEGLATATDLLQAEARAAEMRSRAIDALADHHIAIARLEFVESRYEGEDAR